MKKTESKLPTNKITLVDVAFVGIMLSLTVFVFLVFVPLIVFLVFVFR